MSLVPIESLRAERKAYAQAISILKARLNGLKARVDQLDEELHGR